MGFSILRDEPFLCGGGRQDHAAAEMKNGKIFNMIVLGGLLKVCPVITLNGVEKALYKTLPERHHSLIPLNIQALEEGGKIIEEVK